MTPHVPPFATYVPGADSHLNASRIQSVPFAVLHRTQGTDSRALGKNRLHSSPGTFNFLVRAGVLWCYYPANVRCSHAAGGNDGPGIEIEGYDGDPVADADLEILGQLVEWLHNTYGVPLSFYDGARRQIDDSGFRGFVTHASIATELKWQHADNITAQEWADAIGDSMPLDLKDLVAIRSVVNGKADATAPTLVSVAAQVDALAKQVAQIAQASGQSTTSLVDLLKRMFPNRANR